MKSCLVSQLSHYLTLDRTSLEGLAKLERDERSYKKRERVFSIGEENRFLYIVKSGWLYSYIDLADNRRSIVSVFQPGDLIGYSEVAFERYATNLSTSEQSVLCPFPKHELSDIFEQHPALAALFFAIASRDQIIMIDRMRAISSMSSREKLVYFLLDMSARMLMTHSIPEKGMMIPMSQQEIGDMLGLTNVTVSRELTALQVDGLIEKEGAHIRLMDISALIRMCEFKDRYNKIDTTWLPK